MSAVQTLAGRGRRLGAAIIDFGVVSAVAFIAMWPLGTFEHQQAYEPSQFVIRLVTLLVGSYLLVNGRLLHTRGQTVGKRLLGLRIVAYPDGGRLPLWKLLLRAFSVLAVAAIPFVGLLAIIDTLFIFNKQRRCLHDYLAGSKVV